MANKIKCCTFIVYLEDCTSKKISDVLHELGFAYCISPLHDKDTFNVGKDKGKLKKPHFHVMVQGNLSKKQQTSINIMLGIRENNPFQQVRNTRNMYEYFFHQNADGKTLYNEDDIIVSDDFEIEFKNIQNQSTLKLVYDIIEKENFTDYYQMMRYFLAYPDNDVTEFVFRYDAKFRTYLFFKTRGYDNGRFFP